MIQANIDINGNIQITLDFQDQELAKMLFEEFGEKSFEEVFNLWFRQKVESMMQSRFGRLSLQDKTDLLVKLKGAKP